MAFIKDRRFLSHRSVQSIKVPRKTPERLRKTPERPQEDPRKMQRKPSIEMNISIFLHCGLYRGQKVLEPPNFAVTIQWVRSPQKTSANSWNKYIKLLTLCMASIEDRRSLSHRSLQSHSNGFEVRSIEGPGSPRGALKKPLKTPIFEINTYIKILTLCMASIEDRRSLSHRSLQSQSNGLEAPRKPP